MSVLELTADNSSQGKGQTRGGLGFICFCLVLLKVSQSEILTLLHFAVIQNFENGNFDLSHLISFTLEFLENSGIKKVEKVSPLLSKKFNQIKVRLSQMNSKSIPKLT